MAEPERPHDRDVTVVGAGLAGCLLACSLARRGVRVTVYERRSDPRPRAGQQGQVERGRSINLAISERGLDALRRIDLEPTVMADAIPMRGRMIHSAAGELDFQQYSADGTRAINSISRGDLNNALLDAAESHDGVTIRFDHRLSALDPATGAMTFSTPDGNALAEAGVVIGTDGAGSIVREQLVAHGLVTASSDFLDYGYKELSIPAQEGKFALDPHALHIWPRGTSMAIALPNPDRSFTVTLFWPTTGPGSFDALSDPASIIGHFDKVYPDLVTLATDLVDDYQRNPLGVLGTVHALPWHVTTTPGRGVLLLGDAAHAIVPFYGQGANAAFEDVVVLDRCLDETRGNWPRAMALFEQRRHEHTDAIAQMALGNFVEMRDKVNSPVYKARKRVEHALERLLPGLYVSQYELVSFSTVPYADVRRRVLRQQVVVGGLLAAAVAAGAAFVA
jgi:kynurenine 3-monooxygenase